MKKLKLLYNIDVKKEICYRTDYCETFYIQLKFTLVYFVGRVTQKRKIPTKYLFT